MLITTRTIKKWYINDSEVCYNYSNPRIIDETELQQKTEIQNTDFEEIYRLCANSFLGITDIKKEFTFFGKRQFNLCIIHKIIKEGDILKIVSYDEKINLSIHDLIKIPDTKKVLAYLKQQYEQIDIEKIVQNAD